jgi:hypothetical protein
MWVDLHQPLCLGVGMHARGRVKFEFTQVLLIGGSLFLGPVVGSFFRILALY